VGAAAVKALLAEAAREVGSGAPVSELVRAALRIRGRGLAVKHAPASEAHDRPARWSGDYARVLRALVGPHSVTRDHAPTAA
jgi:hypothetical protein